jgi:predicted DNA binding CopG/RHH family protein
MKKETGKFSNVEYTDEPMELTVIDDFLPSPEELILEEKRARVTINLSASSVAYFKREARKHRTQYQKLIRYVLDHYASSLSRAKGSQRKAAAGKSGVNAGAKGAA